MVRSLASSTPAERNRVSRGSAPGDQASPASPNTLSHSLSAPNGRWPNGLPTSASGSRYSSVAVAARRPRITPPPYPRTGKVRVPAPNVCPNVRPIVPEDTPPTLSRSLSGPLVAPAARRSARTWRAQPPSAGTRRYTPSRERRSFENRSPPCCSRRWYVADHVNPLSVETATGAVTTCDSASVTDPPTSSRGLHPAHTSARVVSGIVVKRVPSNSPATRTLANVRHLLATNVTPTAAASSRSESVTPASTSPQLLEAPNSTVGLPSPFHTAPNAPMARSRSRANSAVA